MHLLCLNVLWISVTFYYGWLWLDEGKPSYNHSTLYGLQLLQAPVAIGYLQFWKTHIYEVSVFVSETDNYK